MTALQGSIKDFGVADIFQLLAQQQKTGVLLVAHDTEAVEIYFLNGDLIDVKTAKDVERLGAVLVKSALVPAEQFRQALEKHKTTLEHICTILLNQGLISQVNFEHILLTHIYEVIYEILQWHTGTYRFVAQTISQTSSLVRLPSLESILLDVLRRIDEWPEIKSVISSFDMLFENNYAVLPDLDSEEERVCSLVDGQRSVQDIIDASVLGSFVASKTLVQLLERGAIRLLSKRAETKSDPGILLSRSVLVGASFCCLAALAALILFLPGSFLESTFPVVRLVRGGHTLLHQAFVCDETARLERALEIYRLLTGAYPETLRALGDYGILTKKHIDSIERHAVVYRKTGGSYDIAITH